MCAFSEFRRRHSRHPGRAGLRGAFTLVEMLVSIVILAAVLVLFSLMLGQASKGWANGSSKSAQFREGRAAFASLVGRLSEATLNPYNGYQYTGVTTGTATNYIPSRYYRRSELRFISGPGSTVVGTSTSPTDAVFFLAPLGQVTDTASYGQLHGLLNICGYYVQWSNADPDRPPILPGSGIYRFRLMQFVEPSEAMVLYSKTSNYPTYSAVTTSPAWQQAAVAACPSTQVWSRPLANNVVALLLLPALSTTDVSGTLGYTYNSETYIAPTSVDTPNPQNRLPPVMRVVLYTIDEPSAQKIGGSSTMPNIYVSGTTTLFTDPTKLYPAADGSDIGDLIRFENVLTKNGLNFRRLETAIQFARAPWKTLMP